MPGIECPGCGRAADPAAASCGACGAVLARACPSCGHRGEPAARFCSACGSPLAAAARAAPSERAVYTPRHLASRILTQRAALEGERKQVTVLFIDLKGSMEIAADVDPEEWHGIMDRFFVIAGDAVHRFEGTVNQYTGDGVMALFGAPLAHEDHAERACHAALALRESLARYAEELKRERGFGFAVRTGLNSGEVVVGRIGDDLRMDYTAQGHTVGLASRMEQLADPGRIYLTEATAALVGGRFRMRDLGPHNVRGVREPVRVFELEGIGTVRTRLEQSRARGFSSLVGRGEEASHLAAGLERACAGDGSVIAVVGEAGVGKSRLCFELAAQARARGVVVREAHALPYGRSVPFLPVLELLRAMLGVAEDDDGDEVRRKVAGTLLLLDQGLHETLPAVFELLGVADRGAPAPRGDPEARQRQLLAIVRRLLLAQAARAPQLLVVEDLHWIDGGSEVFLREIAAAARRAHVLLLLNFRPEYHPAWLADAGCERIALSPLGPEASAAMLVELLGSDPGVGDLAGRIAERTAGNPFFIEEVVRALAAAGSLAGTRGAYRLVEPVATVVLPATVQAVLAARIDRLADGDKAVLETAAVMGKTFARDVLRRVAGVPDPELDRALALLVDAEFILLDEGPGAHEPVYAFTHPLTQEVAYRSQLGARREQVHATVATVLEELYAGRTNEVAALLAHHHEHAGDRLAAARWSRTAAERALRSDVAEAVRLWSKTKELVDGLPPSAETVELAIWAKIQLLNLGWRSGLGDDEARALFESGMESAKLASDVSATSGVLVTYAALRGLSGDPHGALELVVEAARLAREAGDEGTQVATQAALVQTLIMSGRLSDARREIEPAIATAAAHPGLGNEQTGFDTHTWFLAMRGQLLTETGDLAGAARDLEVAHERARALGEMEILGWSHEMSSYLARWLGDPDGALAHGRQSVQIAERMGSAFSQTSAYGTLAIAQSMAGQWAEAAEGFQHVLDIIHARRSFRHWEAVTLAQLGEVEAMAGEHERGVTRVRAGLAMARSRRALFVELIAVRALVRALLEAHGVAARAEVEQLLVRAAELVDMTGAASWAPLVDVEHARLARLAGDEDAARHAFARARSGFAAIGADALAREAAAGIPSRL